MSFVTWVLISFLIGLLVFVATPVVVSPSLPTDLRRRIGGFYFSLAALALGRINICRRKLGGISLSPSAYDSEREAEKIRIGGERLHFDDPHNLMSRLYNSPTSLTYEGSSAIMDPRIAEIGQQLGDWLEAGGNRRTVDGTVHYSREFTIPDGDSLVDPKRFMPSLPGSGTPKLSDTAWEYGKESQSGFSSVPLVQAGSVLMTFAVGFGAVFLGVKYGTGVAPDVSGVSLVLMGVL